MCYVYAHSGYICFECNNGTEFKDRSITLSQDGSPLNMFDLLLPRLWYTSLRPKRWALKQSSHIFFAMIVLHLEKCYCGRKSFIYRYTNLPQSLFHVPLPFSSLAYWGYFLPILGLSLPLARPVAG